MIIKKNWREKSRLKTTIRRKAFGEKKRKESQGAAIRTKRCHKECTGKKNGLLFRIKSVVINLVDVRSILRKIYLKIKKKKNNRITRIMVKAEIEKFNVLILWFQIVNSNNSQFIIKIIFSPPPFFLRTQLVLLFALSFLV